MNEDFVTYKQAVQLKELGFNWECNKFYATQNYCEGNNPYSFDTIIVGDLLDSPKYKEDENDGWIPDEEWCIAAPTLSQSQKWLRDIKNIHIIINIDRWLITTPYRFEIYQGFGENLIHQYTQNDFPTYEQALSVGIDKVTELLKQQNK